MPTFRGWVGPAFPCRCNGWMRLRGKKAFSLHPTRPHSLSFSARRHNGQWFNLRLAFNVQEQKVAVSRAALARPWLRLVFLLSHNISS